METKKRKSVKKDKLSEMIELAAPKQQQRWAVGDELEAKCQNLDAYEINAWFEGKVSKCFLCVSALIACYFVWCVRGLRALSAHFSCLF